MSFIDSQSESWLITGGLGYIGAHIAREFISNGHSVVIVDNLSTGKLARKPQNAIYISGDVRDAKFIHEVCTEYGITGIVHLAAFKHARESRINPSKYWSNNIGATLGLMEGIHGTKVSRVILSSSCSIYGNNPGVNEDSADNPQSPYALTKKVSEELLIQTLPSSGILFTSLRFFNVVGCDSYPEAHDSSEECLIPVISNHIRDAKPFTIFGNTHPTKDGTCVRDYLDVRDLANVHSLVAARIGRISLPTIINVSAGVATTVLEVLNDFQSVVGKEISYLTQLANPADPISVWAHKSRILDEWGWYPKFKLKDSIASHWSSFQKLPG